MTREVIADDEEGPCRLSQLDFTDLYLSEAGGQAKMRGLIDIEDPLYPVPMEAVLDLRELHDKVCLEGQTSDEFPLVHDDVRYRCSKINGEGPAWYALRRAMDPIPRLRTLLVGVQSAYLSELGRIGKRPGRGLILLAGSTGSGKTTTICSLLQEYLIQYGDVATTIEDPPELRLEGSYRKGMGHCFQVRVRDGDFATPLRATLRHQPRYILIGELRDADGASEALRAAISGHIVLATIHAGTIPEAIQSMLKLVSSKLDMDMARTMLADGLAAVIHQEMDRIKAADRVERRVRMRALFLGATSDNVGAGARSKIREGKVNSLVDDIEAQQVRLGRNQPPLLPPNRGR